MKNQCDCCEGVEVTTPLPTRNRPGLSAISFRAGTHATFLETMMARLSSARVAPEPGAAELPVPPLAS